MAWFPTSFHRPFPMPSFFHVPLDLPHAGTVAHRIVLLLENRYGDGDDKTEMLIILARHLVRLLEPYRKDGENPLREEGQRVAKEAARLARGLVDQIEKAGIAEDRLGQHVRNLFECLEMGEEGAQISLRAGEDPKSPQRPG